MKLSLEWLKEYVDLPPGLEMSKLMHDLTMATVEVEGLEDVSLPLANVVVAKVESSAPVDGKPELKRVVCDAGSVKKSVLCGAENVQVGMKVALALPGAVIRPYGGQEQITVTEKDTPNGKSEAVICAASELGLDALFPTENKKAIIDLIETECSAGEPLAKAIGWCDIIFEIDNKSLTNRPDLWGHYGIARELAAIYGCALKPLYAGKPAAKPAIKAGSRLVEQVIDPRCRRFTASYFTNAEFQTTPLWMRSRLARIGQRAISFYADLTNYVMLAIGQPCHVFDASRLSLPLTVRAGKKNERIRLLDGSEGVLDEGVLAIADRNTAVAVAGVMGGADTGVFEGTREVLLEIANFDPVQIRRGAKRMGLRTEASSRFEKSIDTQRIDAARDLFINLVKDVQPQAKLEEMEEVLLTPTKASSISVELPFLRSRLGKDLSADEMTNSLRTIGFEVSASGETLTVLPPSWRSTGDVSQRFDLIEEVARLHGYDDFHFDSLSIALQRKVANVSSTLERRIRETLATLSGMREVVTYPWVKDKYLEAAGYRREDTLHLAGAPAPDQSALQPSLVPNLLESVVTNVRYYSAFRLFEVGTVFPDKDRAGPNFDPKEKLPYQEKRVAAALYGADAEALFLQAKAILERLARNVQIRPLRAVAETSAPWADSSGRMGLVAESKNSNGQVIGTLGVVSNRAKRLAGIRRGALVAFELNIDALEPFPSRENRYQPVPEYPVVDLDLSLVFANEISWASIAGRAKLADPLINEVIFVDQFRGTDIPQGKKSITLRLRLGSPERTLTTEEATAVTSVVSKALAGEFGAVGR